MRFSGWPRVQRNTALVRTQQLSRFYNVPEKRVRKELVELAQQKIVRLYGWDGRQMRALEAWPNGNDFIESRIEDEYLRVAI